MLNISGLLSELAGVLILFLFGMPYLIRGGDFVVTHPSTAGIAKERLYERLGWLGWRYSS